jgi:hypothetical protein
LRIRVILVFRARPILIFKILIFNILKGAKANGAKRQPVPVIRIKVINIHPGLDSREIRNLFISDFGFEISDFN